MMNNFILKLKAKYQLILFLVISTAVLIVFYSFLSGNKTFELIADQKYQYNVFYQEWGRLLKGFVRGDFTTLPLYSFNTFLGADFFVSKMYYIIGDPFSLIVPFVKNIEYATLLYTIFLIYISAFSTFYLLKKIKIENRMLCIVGALVYAFAGIAVIYYGNYMFHRFYAFFPFLLIGVERFIQDKKYGLFMFMIFYLFLQNYYFMYSASLFLIIYYFLSNYLKDNYDTKLILVSSLKLIGAYTVGILMAGIFLVPTILCLMQSQRFGIGDGSLFWDLRVILGILISFICTPFNLYTNIPYLFYYGSNGHAHWYSLFTSIGLFCVFLSSFCNKSLMYKKIRILFFVMLGCLLILPINSAIHGFSEASFRWVFTFIPFLIIVSLNHLDKNKIDKKTFNLFIGYSLFCLIGLGILMLNGHSFKDYYLHYTMIGVSLLLGYGYLWLLYKGKLKIVCCLIFIELILGATFLMEKYSNDYQLTEIDTTNEYIEYFRSIDETKMYRMYINASYFVDQSTINLNRSLKYGYMSTQTYDSTYNQTINEFLGWQGISWHIIDMNSYNLHKFLGVKYVTVESESSLSNPELYEYAYDLNHHKVFKLKDYNNIGFTYNNFIKKTDFEKIADKKNFNYSDTLILNDSDFELVQNRGTGSMKSQFNVEYYGENQIYGSVEANEATVLFISIPNDPGWTAYDSEFNVLEKIDASGGFIGIPLNKGKHRITLQYRTPYLKLGMAITVVGFGLFTIITFLSSKRRKNRLK